MMKEAIARYLEIEEQYEQEKAEDMARWQRYLDTGTAFPHEEVKIRLNELANQAADKTQAK